MRDETEARQQRQDHSRYPGAIRILHWLIVLMVVAQFAIAWTMPDIRRDTRPEGLIAAHLSTGTAILAIMLLRLLVRLTHKVPAPPLDLPPVLRFVSRATHFLLYAILILLPLLGWANASSRGWAVRLFGIIPLPPLAPTGSPLGHMLGDVHQTVAIALLPVAGLHIAGGLYHAFVLRDGVVRRITL